MSFSISFIFVKPPPPQKKHHSMLKFWLVKILKIFVKINSENGIEWIIEFLKNIVVENGMIHYWKFYDFFSCNWKPKWSTQQSNVEKSFLNNFHRLKLLNHILYYVYYLLFYFLNQVENTTFCGINIFTIIELLYFQELFYV